MNRYFIRRILETIPLMLVISIFVFMFIHLIPGEPGENELRGWMQKNQRYRRFGKNMIWTNRW